MKKFLLIGGNFSNTGAEAMTYVTVFELRKKYPDCVIYMVSKDKWLSGKYTFDHINIDDEVIDYLNKNVNYVKFWSKFIAKKIMRKASGKMSPVQFSSILKNCDGIFDISGYAISSQWGNRATEIKMSWLEIAWKSNVPYYFMPQSFGPFNYKADKMKMITKLEQWLPTSKVIFAREKEGYDLLVNLLNGNENVKLSTDMVLQCGKVNYSKVLAYPKQEKKTIVANGKRNVAIIPNMQNFRHGNKDDIIDFYKNIIKEIRNNNCNVYLISHSNDDIEANELIFNNIDKDDVYYIREPFDSIAFEGFIAQFDFAVASRFHSIVHSYKNAVPCIVLGWATKYHELTQLFRQNQYMIDVRSMKTDIHHILNFMMNNYNVERKTIMTILKQVQEQNCFELIDF